MPGFITHYLFGCETIKNIKDSGIRKILKDNKNIYALGLQGPDIFFYFPYSFTGNRKRLASVMHVYDTGRFFNNLIEEIEKLKDKDKNVGIAYLLGFLGHYSLDTICHPYIYYRTGYLNKGKDYFGKHTDFETDVDFLLMYRLTNTKVVDFRQENTIKIDKNSAGIVAGLLNNACLRTYPYIKSNKRIMELAVESFYYSNGILNDRKGYKKKIVSTAERAILGAVASSPLFMIDNKDIVWDDPLNDKQREWKNPWDMSVKSCDSFMKLMEKAKYYYIHLIENVTEEIIKSDSIDYDRLNKLIGNNSYHSGLDCSIPS